MWPEWWDWELEFSVHVEMRMVDRRKEGCQHNGLQNLRSKMNDRYLEITYRKGKVVAAYLYLPRQPREKVKKTTQAAEGILVDYGKGGRSIGIEITAPQQVSRQDKNQVIAKLDLPPFAEEELAPLLAV